MTKEQLMDKANNLSLVHEEKKKLALSMLDEIDLRLKRSDSSDQEYLFGAADSINIIMEEIQMVEEEYADIIDEIKKIK